MLASVVTTEDVDFLRASGLDVVATSVDSSEKGLVPECVVFAGSSRSETRADVGSENYHRRRGCRGLGARGMSMAEGTAVTGEGRKEVC